MACYVGGADVLDGGVGFVDHGDGDGLGVGAGDAVALAFGGLDDELDAAVVGEGLVQLEGEGVTLADDRRGRRSLDADEGRGFGERIAAAGYDPVVEACVEVGAGDLGGGAKDGASLLGESELVPSQDLVGHDGEELCIRCVWRSLERVVGAAVRARW